jgi:hypothetical protein
MLHLTTDNFQNHPDLNKLLADKHMDKANQVRLFFALKENDGFDFDVTIAHVDPACMNYPEFLALCNAALGLKQRIVQERVR